MFIFIVCIIVCVCVAAAADESVDGSWVMRNDTIQTPGGLQTPQLNSTVLRENPRQAAEHVPDQDSSEPGSEPDYIHKYMPA